jgi:hypothetical protein
VHGPSCCVVAPAVLHSGPGRAPARSPGTPKGAPCAGHDAWRPSCSALCASIAPGTLDHTRALCTAPSTARVGAAAGLQACTARGQAVFERMGAAGGAGGRAQRAGTRGRPQPVGVSVAVGCQPPPPPRRRAQMRGAGPVAPCLAVPPTFPSALAGAPCFLCAQAEQAGDGGRRHRTAVARATQQAAPRAGSAAVAAARPGAAAAAAVSCPGHADDA